MKVPVNWIEWWVPVPDRPDYTIKQNILILIILEKKKAQFSTYFEKKKSEVESKATDIKEND